MTQPKSHAIMADPPWKFRTWSETNQRKAASRHYRLMTLDEICWLRDVVLSMSADDCCLFLCATRPLLPHAIMVGDVWGFKYKTVAFTWVKSGKNDPDKRPIGLGYWTRANPEYCLLFTRGNPKRKADATGVRELIELPDFDDGMDTIWSPPREHSRKPDEIYTAIESLVDGPYLEMFARQSWPGWSCWGDETDKFSGGVGDITL